MDLEPLHVVAERYPWASWAIWDDEFPDGACVEQQPERLVQFISERAAELTTDVVLLGLNRAENLPAPFSNFHAPTRTHYDYRLKKFIQDQELHRLHGAYMTDLVDDVTPHSQTITVTDGDAESLLEQLQLLDESEYHVVCFGNKPFDALVEYFDADVSTLQPELRRATVETEGLTLRLYRAWFYGLYGAHQDKVAVFKRQLEELNERLV
jgi:hypothetical protein